MPRKITRWSPNHICGCVFEVVADYDDQGNQISDNQFLLRNTECNKHKHLASTKHKANHKELASPVLDMIEEAKQANIKQADEAISKARNRIERLDLEACKSYVINHFNARLTEEWADLTEQPHAFDSHIHDQIWTEHHKWAKSNQ